MSVSGGRVTDSINHPSHYNAGKIEVIEFIEDQKLNFARGDVIKYVCRAGKKKSSPELEDLRKAAWYLAWEIELLEARDQGRPVRRPNDLNPRVISATGASILGEAEHSLATARTAPQSPTSESSGHCTYGFLRASAQCGCKFHDRDVPRGTFIDDKKHGLTRCGRCGTDLSNPSFDRSQCQLCHGGRDLAEPQPGTNRMGLKM